jgi:membrane protein required for colicin V production
MANINLLDAGIALIFILFFVRGLLRGMISEIAGLVGIFLAFFIAAKHYPHVVPHVQRFIANPDGATVVAYALTFTVVLVGIALAAVVIRKFMNLTFTAWVDYVGGAVVGCAEALLLCSLALVVLRRYTPDLPMLRTSLLAPHISQIADLITPYIPTSL